MCPSACTDEFSEPLHLFSAELHMHIVGAAMWSSVYEEDSRGGLTKKYEIQRADHYDFLWQQITPFDLIMNPGDVSFTNCHWDTRERSGLTAMGIPSEWEMCMHFVNYWPRQTWGNDDQDFAYCGQLGGLTMCGNDNDLSILPISNPGRTGDPNYEEDKDAWFGVPCRRGSRNSTKILRH